MAQELDAIEGHSKTLIVGAAPRLQRVGAARKVSMSSSSTLPASTTTLPVGSREEAVKKATPPLEAKAAGRGK